MKIDKAKLLRDIHQETIPSLLKKSLDKISAKTGLKQIYTQAETKQTAKAVEIWSTTVIEMTLSYIGYSFDDHYIRYAAVLNDFLTCTYLKAGKSMECVKIAIIRLYLFVLALLYENSRCYRKIKTNKELTSLSKKVLSSLRAELNRFLVLQDSIPATFGFSDNQNQAASPQVLVLQEKISTFLKEDIFTNFISSEFLEAIKGLFDEFELRELRALVQ